MQNFNRVARVGQSQEARTGSSAWYCCHAGRTPALRRVHHGWRKLPGWGVLRERGIRPFETYTRNTLDISAIPIIHKLSHLPMASDPSHGTGIRDKVAPMARASVAAGADVLLIEVHHDPDKALSDGAQSLYPDQFSELMDQLRMIAPAVGRKIA